MEYKSQNKSTQSRIKQIISSQKRGHNSRPQATTTVKTCRHNNIDNHNGYNNYNSPSNDEAGKRIL